MIKEIGFDGMERTYLRDGSGRVTKVLRPGARWSSYQYDGVGNIMAEEQYDGSITTYRYNADGLLLEAKNAESAISLNRDSAGRIIEENQGEYTVNRTYNHKGECIAITSSLGADSSGV